MKAPKKTKVKKICYQNLLLAMLGVTKALAKADIKPPTKWMVFLESLSASSNMLHVKLSMLDDEVEEDFIHKEEMFEKRIGKEKFYDVEEIEELKNKSDRIEV